MVMCAALDSIAPFDRRNSFNSRLVEVGWGFMRLLFAEDEQCRRPQTVWGGGYP